MDNTGAGGDTVICAGVLEFRDAGCAGPATGSGSRRSRSGGSGGLDAAACRATGSGPGRSRGGGSTSSRGNTSPGAIRRIYAT